MELKKDKLKSILSARKKLLSFFLLFTGLAVIIVVVSSIYKQYWSSSGTVRVIKHASHKSNKPSAAPIPKSSPPKPKQKTVTAEKKTSGETKVSKKESSPDVISVIKSAKEQAFIYKAKKEALKEKLEYLKLKKELEEYSQELAPPVMPKPSELSVRLTEIQQKLYELERKLDESKKPSAKESLKEKLKLLKAQIQSQLTGKNNAPDNRKYELVAILDSKAVIKVDGKEYTVKDGQEFFGQKVQVDDFSVKVGDKILTLNLSGKSRSKNHIPLPPPFAR